MTPDMPVFAVAYYDTFGYERPLYTLGHDNCSPGRPLNFSGAPELSARLRTTPRRRWRPVRWSWCSRAAIMTFIGLPRRKSSIDFGGRSGYVTTAIEAGVPIVPAVSIGAQESQLYLTRGRWLARALRLTGLERRLFRSDILPITFGFPFGLSVVVPVNVPIPTKIVTLVLPPIDIVAKFGAHPAVAEVDAHVRSVMQSALTRLARRRRLPIIG